MERRVDALKVVGGSHRHRQPVRILLMPLSIERSRPDENCSFCPIRQLCSSLYFVIVPYGSTNGPAGDSYRAIRHVSRRRGAPTVLMFGCLGGGVLLALTLEFRCVDRCDPGEIAKCRF